MQQKNQKKPSFFISIFLIHFCIQAGLSNLYRLYLIFQSDRLSLVEYAQTLFLGFTFDLATAIYTFIPYIILFLIFTPKTSQKTFHLWLLGLLGADFFGVQFSVISEYFFFKEFNDRFNFIAVDYLVYTNEVLKNVWESYHLLPICFALLTIAIVGIYYFNKKYFSKLTFAGLNWKNKLVLVSGYALIFCATLFIINEKDFLSSVRFADQILLSKNGMHSLFAAYRNNEISFDKYYPNMDQKKALSLVHEALKSKADTENLAEDDSTFARNIVSDKPALRKNVVLVLMESLSARYLGSYGNQQSLTPNLDRLTLEGLFFNNAFSTGTRTVRGLEAITLSIPPTPGQSIVRRPAGTNLFNIATVFNQFNYETKFIYGGNASFDNMGAFFAGNGFTVVDQNRFTKDEGTFSNAWGFCDEDLFNKVIHEANLSHHRKQLFFSLVLTTSNHRPYTYPENKIDIPSGRDRDGAVKYSDFSIGEFLKKAQKQPWFKDTVFVFASDHNASVAGSEKILIEDYRVPVIFYSPGFIKPQTVTHLMSQIDVAPTLFGLLNFSYQSRFFGVNALSEYPRRAFLSTYQKIGYYTGDNLVVLSPTKIVETSKSQPEQKEIITEQDEHEIQSAVAFYKAASDMFRDGFLSQDKKFSPKINIRKAN